ncbi:Pre-mRNA-splicing ATP-dependent RNA helicase PRP28 [Scheffersomyces amazonensis]|uniref:Pre-mRNA-splicing ATP-dependent RNA helicase PRP28 n=1 Tax=Scheffersomyces amazonensis TaxID=1078765 RepID=UPI00315C8BA8
MSRRPISVEELLEEDVDLTGGVRRRINGISNRIVPGVGDKPVKFLSKAERERLSIEKKLKQEAEEKKNREQISEKQRLQIRKHQQEEEYRQQYQQDDERATNKKEETIRKKRRKFNFEWDEEEDTSNDYKPMIVTESRIRKDVEDDIVNDKHWSEKKLEDMTVRDWRIFKEDFSIIYKNVSNDIKPLRDWTETNIISSKIVNIINNLSYVEPTPIQRASIPITLSNQDAIGIAKTGSGKTLAFLVPLLTYILNIDRNYFEFEHKQQEEFNKPLGLILVPTRELALQISKEADKFCKPLSINVVTIIGGHKYEETISSIGNGVHIVVATPGRLIDSLEQNIISLDKCYYLIMDEADRMIDMGFEASLTSIFKYLPSQEQLISSIDSKIFGIDKRVTLMFTATITPIIEKITKNYLYKPAYITIGQVGEATDNIDQEFEYMNSVIEDPQELDESRFKRLLTVINGHERKLEPMIPSIIIFANYKKVCDALATKLAANGWKDTVVIHGSKNQENREWSINNFRNHESRVLIATDVAARGIDVSDVSLVVNFQMVTKFEEYIHRIGRTGRAGKKGLAYSFIDDSNRDIFLNLKKYLTKGGKKSPDWLMRATQTQNLRD